MPIADLPPPPSALQAPSFDLAQLQSGASELDLRAVKPRCPIGRPGEIVVCAPDPKQNRTKPQPDAYAMEEGLPRAELGLGENASIDIHLDKMVMPTGQTASRVMVGAKIKF